MVTPLSAVHTNGICSSFWPLASTKSLVSPTSLKPSAPGTGVFLSSLAQPLIALYGCAGSSVSRRTGGLPSSLVCGNCSSSASSTRPPSSTRRSTSVVTVTRWLAGVALACACTAAWPGAPGTCALGMPPEAAPGTLCAAAGADVVVGAGVGAAFSRLHSIHSSTATISQAKMRNTRVWFISGQARRGRDAMPARSKKELRCHQAAALCRPRPARAMHAGDAAGAGRPGGSRRCWRNAQHYGPRRRSRLAGYRYVSDAGCRAGRA